MKWFLALVCITIVLSSCTMNSKSSEYRVIDAKEAKNIIDNEKNIIILDVRTKEEYDEGHIKNSVLIPDYLLQVQAEQYLKDKNQKILIYCRSGRRSLASAKLLANMGYKNVYDFGGILDWPYETVK